MGKLTLLANPTFKAKVPIPVAGGDPVEIEFTFRHRTKTGLDEFMKSRKDQTDIDSFMAMVEGWELEDEFSKENASLLLENYIGVAAETYRTYIEELANQKLGN